MAFNWKEYYDLAKFLQGQTGSNFTQEAAFRSAVSRAYYAAFCYGRNYAQDRLEFTPQRNAEDHGHLIERLRDRKLGHIAQKLGRLRQWRNNCDYDDTVGDLPPILAASLTYTQEVFNTLT